MVASVPPPPRDKSTFQNNLGSIKFFYLASAACIIASKRWRRHVASAQVLPSPAAASGTAARHSRLMKLATSHSKLRNLCVEWRMTGRTLTVS
jgi:hypothetical protein